MRIYIQIFYEAHHGFGHKDASGGDGARHLEDVGGAAALKETEVSKDQQVTRTRTRQHNKPLTRTQSEQRRNDA